MTATTEQATYSVPDVSCEHCVAAVSEALGPIDGVSTVTTDLGRKVVIVNRDPTRVSTTGSSRHSDDARIPGHPDDRRLGYRRSLWPPSCRPLKQTRTASTMTRSGFVFSSHGFVHLTNHGLVHLTNHGLVHLTNTSIASKPCRGPEALWTRDGHGPT